MAITITPSPFGSVTVTLDGELAGTLSVNMLATSNSVLNMDLGVPGPQGEQGEPGANGVGVPTGGTAGQVLAKIDGTNYNTEWTTPSGGTWGSITGTLSSQTDLQNALNGKLSLTGGTVTGTVNIAETGSNLQLNVSNGSSGETSIYGGEIQVIDGLSTLYLFSDRIEFPNGSTQYTAFPPAGGTSAQYIDGTGALTTFPTSIKTASQMVTSVRNNTGATLTKGTVVYINGAVGNKPTVTKAQANSEAGSKATYGFVESGIANNADGNVVVIGLLENIDTQGFADGTQIFLSPTVAGGFTSTQPFSPYHYVRLGTVIRGNHPTQGSIEVNIQNGFQLDEMSDVGATSPTNNNVLTWVSASSQWLDRSITTILGYTPADVANYAYATTAQAQAGTSTTTVINPSTLLDAKFFAGYKPLSMVWTWTSAVSGAGASTTVNGQSKNVFGPTSATGSAMAYILNYNSSRGQQSASGADFTKRTTIGGRFIKTTTTADANTAFRFLLGKSIPSPPAGDLASRGIGFRQVANGALELQVHNGTTLYNVTSSFTPTANQSYDVVIVADAGTATMFINGSSVATSANAPTALLGTNIGILEVETQNTATLTGSALNYACSDMFVQTNL